MQKLVKTGKYTEITNNPMSNFGLIEEKMEQSHIHSAVSNSFSYDMPATLILVGTHLSNLVPQNLKLQIPTENE